MGINVSNTVRDIAVNSPGATRIFESMGIDYCCGGQKTLQDACLASGISVEEIAGKLNDAASRAQLAGNEIDWSNASLSGLIKYIEDSHHTYTREALARISKLLKKVVAVHGGHHTELIEVQKLFTELVDELEPHLQKEEEVLFPFIMNLEEALKRNSLPPTSCFGTVRNPVRMMNIEHETAGELLRGLRASTGNYSAPEDACMSYRTLYEAMQELETDLHRHIHLENNILFPRAVKAEEIAFGVVSQG